MDRNYNYIKQIAIFFFFVLAIAGPPILSTGYEKIHKYITQGRWNDYSYMEVIKEDGKKSTVIMPIMIDDWGTSQSLGDASPHNNIYSVSSYSNSRDMEIEAQIKIN